MKYLITFCCSLFIGLISVAQPGGPTLHPLERTSTYGGQLKANDMIYERGIMSVKNVSCVINGATVNGSPFLYYEWYPGTVYTLSGRTFDGYKLRYDVYHQVLLFNNAGQSLEVNEPVRKFTLMAPGRDNKIEQFTFIFSDEIKKEAKPFYYELLAENESGQLLKMNTKKIAEADMELALKSDTKIFKLESSLYYYDVASKKITRIKANGSNIRSMLKLPVSAEEEIAKYDFSRETDVIGFFKNYFSSKTF
jgi:hypothetical protein